MADHYTTIAVVSRRWKIERSFPWLVRFRWLARYEQHALNGLGFVHLDGIAGWAPPTADERLACGSDICGDICLDWIAHATPIG